MSTETALAPASPEDAPELTALGKRLEILRIERGVSKQGLALHAGTSRQQLWRVMTGKSELTTALRERLASALSVQPMELVGSSASSAQAAVATTFSLATPSVMSATTIGDYLADASHLAATLRTLPSGDEGRRLKRALLNSVEDLAVESGRALPFEYSEIRRRVLAGEL